jgi:hypothetical protein
VNGQTLGDQTLALARERFGVGRHEASLRAESIGNEQNHAALLSALSNVDQADPERETGGLS